MPHSARSTTIFTFYDKQRSSILVAEVYGGEATPQARRPGLISLVFYYLLARACWTGSTLVLMKTARKIVSIVGAGTQGRRTAYMWSSQGGNVCLIDRNEKQLQDAKTYIADLRAADGKVGQQRPVGVIDVCTPEKAEQSLSNSWLILEVANSFIKIL